MAELDVRDRAPGATWSAPHPARRVAGTRQRRTGPRAGAPRPLRSVPCGITASGFAPVAPRRAGAQPPPGRTGAVPGPTPDLPRGERSARSRPVRPAAAAPSGPVPVPAPRTTRPMRRGCVSPTRRPGARGGRGAASHGRAERLLLGVATAVCSATVVVVLGLLADTAAAWNATPADPGLSVTAPVAP